MLLDLPAGPPELTLHYRHDLMRHIFRAVYAGGSCAVVGLRGAGLSNALRFSAEPRVIANYLNPLVLSTLPIYLETGWLTQPADLQREIVKQLVRTAELFNFPKADQTALHYLEQQLDQATVPDDVLSKAVTLLCHTPQHRLIFIFDEFDQPFLQLPAPALRRLRQLRDEHKLGVCYVVGTLRELSDLNRQRAAHGEAVDKFTELFDEDTYPLPPYSPADAREVIARKTFDWPQRPTADDEEQLYRLAGGHAKLLVALLRFWESRQHLEWNRIERAAEQDQHLLDLCAMIWDDLNDGERFALFALSADRRAEIPPADLERLRKKGLIIGRPPGVFANLFEAYIETQGPIAPAAQAAPASRLRELDPDIQW